MPGGQFLFIGNPLTDGTWNYTWEKGRQLRRMENASKRVTFTYDASGMRIKKTVNETDVTSYTYHGKNLVHLKKTGGTEMHFYYDAQNRPAIVNYNGSNYAYVYNLQGDVMALLDNTGTKVVSYSYNAWGKLLNTSGSMASTLGVLNPFRYRGYIYDEETGYYYLRSRYYYPNRGRFINADTTFVIHASYKSLTDKNLFAYCDNNSVMRTDHNGTFWDTFFDILSLGFSICEVAVNPGDPWAWAGLLGDVVDLVPFVTGVGEMTKAITTANKVGDVITIQRATDFTDAAAETVKNLDRSTGFTKSVKETGTAIHTGYKFDMPGKEYKEMPGIRPDFVVDGAEKIIYELKPFNPRSVKQGIKQLQRYNKKLGGGYAMILEVY